VTPRSKPLLITLLLLAILLSACDPTSRPFTAILQVASTEDALVAYSVESRSWGPGCCSYGDILYYESRDGGLTWEETLTPPAQMQHKLARAERRLSQACDTEYLNQCTRVDGLGRAWRSTDGGAFWYSTPTYYLFEDIDDTLAFKSLDYRPVCSQANPQVCFRLTRQGQIQSSTDGGQAWEVDWQLSQGRKEYLQRLYARYRPGIPDGFRPLDLALLDTPQGMVVAAALGTQGVLVRSPDGSWQAHDVGTASPLPDRARSPGGLFGVILSELGRAVFYAAVLGALIFLAAYMATGILFKGRGRATASAWLPALRRLALLYMLLMFAVLFLPYLLWTLAIVDSLQTASWISLGLGILLALLALAHTLASLWKFSRRLAD
jgi:hypothetical protein